MTEYVWILPGVLTARRSSPATYHPFREGWWDTGLTDCGRRIGSGSHRYLGEKMILGTREVIACIATPCGRCYRGGLPPQVDRLEQLAALEHDQWVEWSRTIAAQGLTPERLARWEAYWKPYAELDEATKEFDRKWARLVLRALYPFTSYVEPR